MELRVERAKQTGRGTWEVVVKDLSVINITERAARMTQRGWNSVELEVEQTRLGDHVNTVRSCRAIHRPTRSHYFHVISESPEALIAARMALLVD